MKPENHDFEEVRSALRKAFPPVDAELHRDLWPAMRRRLEAPPQRVPWYDWVLTGGLAGALVVFPKLVLFFAYHL
jgi:hypothetical protein